MTVGCGCCARRRENGRRVVLFYVNFTAVRGARYYMVIRVCGLVKILRGFLYYYRRCGEGVYVFFFQKALEFYFGD